MCPTLQPERRAPKVSGPLWVGPMHDATYVAAMSAEAEARGWDEPYP